MENDLIWMDIFAIEPRIRKKLHLTDEEIELTQEDIELINESDYVNLNELKRMLNTAGFHNFDIPNELGISKAMFTMAFSETSKNRRGLRMRTIVAMLNAIRKRNIKDPFDKILVRREKE